MWRFKLQMRLDGMFFLPKPNPSASHCPITHSNSTLLPPAYIYVSCARLDCCIHITDCHAY